MKKVIRLVFSAAILSSFAISQLPSPAACQMVSDGLLAQSCSLPCCKAHLPMPKCPFLKASLPRDLIASPMENIKNTLQPIHDTGWIAISAPRRIVTLVVSFVETLQYLFAGPAQTTRAPPSDVHLQDA
jgi:hypothetical protein